VGDAARERRLDVVVVMIDTLRPDRLELYGYGRETAPFLAELGRESVVFRRAFSTSSWTAPATASLFTGLYPNRHGVIEGMRAHQRRQEAEKKVRGAPETQDALPRMRLNSLPAAVRTLPEWFRERGYRTFGVSANLNVDRHMGFDRGFDLFACDVKADARTLVARLDEWREEILAADPAFVYLHFLDPHEPYVRHAPWYERKKVREEDLQSRYHSEIRYLDGHLRELYQRYGWERDAILVFVSDHGEEFWEHGLSGHQFSLHNELGRVLFMVHAPALGIGRRDVTVPVSLVDLLPTLLDLAGAGALPEFDGRSLRALLFPGARASPDFAERIVFAHRADGGRTLWSATDGRFHLIERDGAGGGSPLFYDMDADYLEQENLAGTHGDQERLARALAGFRQAGIDRSGEEIQVPIDGELMDALRSLGYVDGEGPEHEHPSGDEPR
jgi:arylsulfatase A-like enzyme